jgi:monoamine oxidase
VAPDSNGEMLDVAIVGAGVSGVYTGWRLLTDSPPGRAVPTVQVFEQSHRIGGRLLSVEPPGIPGVFCELCGMRYMSSQALVRSLIENKLKLETRPFVVQMPENLNYCAASGSATPSAYPARRCAGVGRRTRRSRSTGTTPS